MAMNGLEKSREIVAKNGTVSVLMTITGLNYREVSGLADLVFGRRLADEIHFTLMTPARKENMPIEVSVSEFIQVWRQLVHTFGKFNRKRERVFFRIFETGDMLKLAEVVGRERLWRGLTDLGDTGVKTGNGGVLFAVDGVTASYFPVSLWPHEAFLIDADAVNRLAHMQQFTIAELRTAQGETKKYTAGQLSKRENYRAAYRRAVTQWLDNFGHDYLKEEGVFFNGLRREVQERR